LALAMLAVLERTGVAGVQTATGTIEGFVRLDGPAPANPLIRMGADPRCAKINAGTRRRQEVVLRGDNGGLANVFVYLTGSYPALPPPATPVVVDQRGCVYLPRVVGVRVGQTLRFQNGDPTVHNVHGVSTRGNDFNTSQPQAGIAFEFRPTSPEVMLRVKCDIHSWMTLYVGVVEHPFFAVTDQTGRFRIEHVPAGAHTVQAWHEYYGTLTTKVDVPAGAVTAVDLVYPAGAKP
jgi:plastocyanin